MQSRNKINVRIFFGASLLSICLVSCSKLVDVPEPLNSITTNETFSSDATATSAVIGIYNNLVTGNNGGGYGLSYSTGIITIDAGMSADELHMYTNGPSSFETNSLNVSNFPGDHFWNNPYFSIYLCNTVIEGLSKSTGVSLSTRNQLTGEAKFLRAFGYFYLVNLFGDVPLALTTDYSVTSNLARKPNEEVYKQIISDLKDAASLLQNDYSVSSGERTRVNKAGAMALLARAYLYQKQWKESEETTTAVISNNLYALKNDLNEVFLANSNEAILQWYQHSDIWPFATIEANTIIPQLLTRDYPPDVVAQYWHVFVPTYYLSSHLLNAFETFDQRKSKWMDTTGQLNGTNYYYPGKYKVRVGTQGNISEQYMVLRLAEQYLIRAEARAQQGNLSGAIEDLNLIRKRAGLDDLSASLTQDQVLAAVKQERRIELFAEWGSRWLDLKRWGDAEAVLGPIKGSNWQTSDQLYPIPSSELTNNASLIQNPGY